MPYGPELTRNFHAVAALIAERVEKSSRTQWQFCGLDVKQTREESPIRPVAG